jgi:hypothetical protein
MPASLGWADYRGKLFPEDEAPAGVSGEPAGRADSGASRRRRTFWGFFLAAGISSAGQRGQLFRRPEIQSPPGPAGGGGLFGDFFAGRNFFRRSERTAVQTAGNTVPSGTGPAAIREA